MKQQQGFTLIELIVVVVLVGILAAVAAPKFTGLQTDARVAKLKGVSSAVQSAAVTIHSTVLARGGVSDTVACAGGGTANNLAGLTGTVCTTAGLVDLVYGYPAAGAITSAGIIAATGLSNAVFIPTLANLNASGYGASAIGGVTTFSVIGGTGTSGEAGAQANLDCSFTYSQPTAANTSPVISVNTATAC